MEDSQLRLQLCRLPEVAATVEQYLLRDVITCSPYRSHRLPLPTVRDRWKV